MLKNVKKLTFVALLLIILGAFFVRTYNFEGWLYFKMDQARDAFMINNAYQNGPGYLPLLGARAGATDVDGFLRLGPASYYFQYLSTLIFNSAEPHVLAYPDLLFSIAAIVLLYLFARLYFSREHSLMITAMYAFSFIIIQYSRFAWNPNSLQFFLLLCFYGLLRFFREKSEKKKYIWLSLWALGIIVGSQLHFFGFFGLMGISGLFIAIKLQIWRKGELLKCFAKKSLTKFVSYFALFFLMFAIFYSPVIISDVQRGGENTKNFFAAIGSKPGDKPFTKKISKSISENIKYYCLITTSQCYGQEGAKESAAKVVTVVIILAGIALALWKFKSEKDLQRRDFLVLLMIWIGVYFILMIPFAYQLRPRFFIVVFAIPFMLLGLIYEYLETVMNRKHVLAASIFITSFILLWNSYGTYAWFREQADSQEKTTQIKRSLILKAKDGVLLSHLQNVTDWMYERHEKGKTLYFYVKPEHVRPFEYLLHAKNDKELVYETMKINEDPDAEYFAITPTKNGLQPVYKKFGEDITLVENKEFGQLMVSKILVNNRDVSADFRFNRPKTKTDRVFWKDVFGTDGNRDEGLEDITGEE